MHNTPNYSVMKSFSYVGLLIAPLYKSRLQEALKNSPANPEILVRLGEVVGGGWTDFSKN